MRQRIAAHPHALTAILHTARALRRSPDAVSARDVAASLVTRFRMVTYVALW